MVVLVQWIFAHLLADFVLQTPRMVRHKLQHKAGSWLLYLHCLIHGALIYLFTPNWQLWPIPVIVVVTHYFIDLWKLHQKEGVASFLIDQFLHLLVLFLLWWWYFAPPSWGRLHLEALRSNRSIWIIAVGYLTVTFPLSYLLANATKRWRLEAEEGGMRSATSLSEAGKWIGIFERILVFTFVITSHFEGIGFLITAKSILRFGDIKGENARKEAEYVLIGTLMSFSCSILIGLLVWLTI